MNPPRKENIFSILSCFDEGCKPRKEQEDFLNWVEENYDRYDVFVGALPTATGKSRIATAIANWNSQNALGKTAILTGNTMLQDQYAKDFEWLPVLKGQSNYQCLTNLKSSCKNVKTHTGSHCSSEAILDMTGQPKKTCPYLGAMSDVKASDTAIFNYHSYLYGSLKILQEERPNLIIDEAHGLSAAIKDMCSLSFWKCEVNFPDFDSEGDFNGSKKLNAKKVQQWLTTYKEELTEYMHILLTKGESQEVEIVEQKIASIQGVLYAINLNSSDVLILQKEKMYHNLQSDLHNTVQPVLYIRPINTENLSSLIIPNQAQKIYLLSATINKNDIKQLGLHGKRVGYFDSPSPIPTKNRPFIFWPIADMSYKKRLDSLPDIIKGISKIADRHADSKGIIHATYGVASSLKKAFGHDSRFLFHDQKNKTKIYQDFRMTKTSKILVASGMAEGIDLPDDAARWQIICMVIYPSLEDDSNFYNMKNNKQAYTWDTFRNILQQYGRIVRHKDDLGVTYMLDVQFKFLYDRAERSGCVPAWFKSAIVK